MLGKLTHLQLRLTFLRHRHDRCRLTEQRLWAEGKYSRTVYKRGGWGQPELLIQSRASGQGCFRAEMWGQLGTKGRGRKEGRRRSRSEGGGWSMWAAREWSEITPKEGAGSLEGGAVLPPEALPSVGNKCTVYLSVELFYKKWIYLRSHCLWIAKCGIGSIRMRHAILPT